VLTLGRKDVVLLCGRGEEEDVLVPAVAREVREVTVGVAFGRPDGKGFEGDLLGEDPADARGIVRRYSGNVSYVKEVMVRW
jgi:hypothetical protein